MKKCFVFIFIFQPEFVPKVEVGVTMRKRIRELRQKMKSEMKFYKREAKMITDEK